METDEYPTKEQLSKIEKWDITKEDAIDLINSIQSIWKYADDVGYFSLKETKNNTFKLKISTGGWSGNEDIISSLRKNMFWTIYWQKTERGGHYLFTGKSRKNEFATTKGSLGYIIEINNKKYGVSASNIGIAVKRALNEYMYGDNQYQASPLSANKQRYIARQMKELRLPEMKISAKRNTDIQQKIAVKKMLTDECNKHIINL